jgi:transcriptional regulator with XRE-family HTH domain
MGCSRQNVHELLANIREGAPERAGHLHCRQCKAALCRRRQGMWTTRPTLCLECLAAWPEAPFGERLRAFRLARGMTTDELALQPGLWFHLVNSYERPQAVRFDWPTLLRLARVLGVELLCLGLQGPIPSLETKPGRPVTRADPGLRRPRGRLAAWRYEPNTRGNIRLPH